MHTYRQLTAQLEKLNREVARVRQQESARVIAEIRQKIAEYEITAEELGFSGKRTAGHKNKAVLPPRYRNQKTGETWSGRGREPAWIAGKNRGRFLIEEV